MLVQNLITKRTEQKPTFEVSQQGQQGIKVLLGIPIIMALVIPHIGRVQVEEGILAVPAPDDSQGITTFNLGLLESDRISPIL
jgi:hypothetical protein